MKTEGRPRVSGPLTPPPNRPASQTPPTPPPPPTQRSARASSPETASIHQTVVPDAALKSQLPSRRLSPSEFNTAMVHLYRGEVQRSNTWRNRLDTTTNWAVLTAGATLSFAFSSPTNPHFVIIINSVLVAFFLFMEARRYRYYEIWSSRVRVLETGYYAQILQPHAPADDAWAEHLVEDLIAPHFTISEWEAAGRRLRRNYLWIFALLALSWNVKVYIHPLPAYDFNAFIERASVGFIPGEVVFLAGVVFNLGILVFALATLRLREATGEVLPRYQFTLRSFGRMTSWTRSATQRRSAATERRAKRARERARSLQRSGQLSGEWKRSDLHDTKPPDADIHETKLPEAEKTLR